MALLLLNFRHLKAREMSSNDDFRVRPGRIRSTRAPRTKPFLAQALQAAQKAGGLSRGSGSRSSNFGRGRAASLAASRMLQARGRGAMVKARVVRQMRSPGALRAHIGYLKRDGVTRDGRPESCSMPPEMRQTAGLLPSDAKATGTISGSSSRRMTPASCQACEVLPGS
jgi:hypothetical protein